MKRIGLLKGLFALPIIAAAAIKPKANEQLYTKCGKCDGSGYVEVSVHEMDDWNGQHMIYQVMKDCECERGFKRINDK